MEQLKPLQDILKPDDRSSNLVRINLETNKRRSIEIDDFHMMLSAIKLDENVPEDVRSYFETIKNVFLYGWFVYQFYTVAMFLSYTSIEMALRIKFQEEDPKRKWPFHKLIREAKLRKIITDERFAAVKDIPYLRNLFAHPDRDMTIMPWQASATLNFAAEIINQLFK